MRHVTFSRRAWLVWGVGVLAYAVAVFQRSSLGVAATFATERFGIGASVFSTFAVLQLVMYAVMQVPVGVLVDRFGPRVLVALGATALRPLFAGRQTVGGLRGAPHASRYGIPAVVTVHPSAIVRLREREERRAAFDAFVRDLRLAAAAADPDS